MKLIVTGGSGFIGSNLILTLYRMDPDVEIFNIDKLTYAADNSTLQPLKTSKRYHFSKLDLFDREVVREVVRKWNPEGVIHLAAESHVDNSIKGPEPFVHSNLIGTFNILEECRQLWSECGDDCIDNRFLHVSTDEVYGTLGEEGSFTETSPYAPSSPYSATKAGSDLLVHSYHRTYGMNVVITNCTNNFGPHQHDEKLIPTVIRRALAHEPIPVYGDGSNVRDWLYVEDHCRALLSLLKKGRSGQSYVIGANNEWKNIDLIRLICTILDREAGDGPEGSYGNLIQFVADRPGHDYRYSVSTEKIHREIGWEPSSDFEGQLRETVLWYIEKYRAG